MVLSLESSNVSNPSDWNDLFYFTQVTSITWPKFDNFAIGLEHKEHKNGSKVALY